MLPVFPPVYMGTRLPTLSLTKLLLDFQSGASGALIYRVYGRLLTFLSPSNSVKTICTLTAVVRTSAFWLSWAFGLSWAKQNGARTPNSSTTSEIPAFLILSSALIRNCLDHPLLFLLCPVGHLGLPFFQRFDLEPIDLEWFEAGRLVFRRRGRRHESKRHFPVLTQNGNEACKCLTFVRRNEDFWLARRHRAQ